MPEPQKPQSSPPSRPISRKYLGWAVAVLLAVACVFYYHASEPNYTKSASDAIKYLSPGLVSALQRDQSLFRTSNTVAALADTGAEHSYAARAQKLADEVFDRSLAIAQQQAAQAAAAAPPAAETSNDDQRVRQTASDVARDQASVAVLQAQIKSASTATAPALQQQLDVANAQLTLDQARHTDAVSDAGRSSTSDEALLQEIQRDHDAAEHNAGTASAQADPLAAQASERNPRLVHGLIAQLYAAWLQEDKYRRLSAAQTAADAASAQVKAVHDRLNRQLTLAVSGNKNGGPAGKSPTTSPTTLPTSSASQISNLQSLTRRQQQISQLDEQSDTLDELASVYKQWQPVPVGQRTAALHASLRLVLILLAVIAVLLLLQKAVRHTIARLQVERRRAHTLEHLIALCTRLIAGAAVVIVLFGQPAQLLTVIGLCAAGLTVAFQDAILSLAGWFVLIGRHGVRLGDWVEINGVVGEVVEFQLLRTVLLETGNWIEPGHPTGRRVFFPNNFALKGSYFNFSTSGQWLWDELTVQLPADIDAHRAVAQVASVLEKETRSHTQNAEEEWKHLSQVHAPFSTAPAVQLKPGGAGLTLAVRYIVTAQQRAAVRARLYGAILGAIESVRQEQHTSASPK